MEQINGRLARIIELSGNVHTLVRARAWTLQDIRSSAAAGDQDAQIGAILLISDVCHNLSSLGALAARAGSDSIDQENCVRIIDHLVRRCRQPHDGKLDETTIGVFLQLADVLEELRLDIAPAAPQPTEASPD